MLFTKNIVSFFTNGIEINLSTGILVGHQIVALLYDIGVESTTKTSIRSDGNNQNFVHGSFVSVFASSVAFQTGTEPLQKLGKLVRIGTHSRNSILCLFQLCSRNHFH